MIFKTPNFWYQSRTIFSWRKLALTPVSWIYAVGRWLHVALTVPRLAPRPVICVGNINAGGSGKTPTSIALMSLIQQENLASKAAFLLRGYGGKLVGPLLVHPHLHNASHVGEEALILSNTAQTYVSRCRYNGAVYAQQDGADLLIMDDGLQSRSLAATVNLTVINGNMGFGNEAIIPAGPLREPLKKGVKRSDAFVLIGNDEHNIQQALPSDKPVFKACITTPTDQKPDTKNRYLAFAGLGYPQKFFDYLRDDLGLNVDECISFQDHYSYTLEDLEQLDNTACQKSLTLITTEKDFMQLQRFPAYQKMSIVVVPIEIQFKSPKKLIQFLKKSLKEC